MEPLSYHDIVALTASTVWCTAPRSIFTFCRYALWLHMEARQTRIPLRHSVGVYLQYP